MPDPSPSMLTVLNSNFLQLGRSGGWPQWTIYSSLPHLSTEKHTALAGIEPTTFPLLEIQPFIRQKPCNLNIHSVFETHVTAHGLLHPNSVKRLGHRKLEWRCYLVMKQFRQYVGCFDSIPACHRRTELLYQYHPLHSCNECQHALKVL